MAMHLDPHELAGQTVTIRDGVTDPAQRAVVGGAEYRIEDWRDRIAGNSRGGRRGIRGSFLDDPRGAQPRCPPASPPPPGGSKPGASSARCGARAAAPPSAAGAHRRRAAALYLPIRNAAPPPPKRECTSRERDDAPSDRSRGMAFHHNRDPHRDRLAL